MTPAEADNVRIVERIPPACRIQSKHHSTLYLLCVNARLCVSILPRRMLSTGNAPDVPGVRSKRAWSLIISVLAITWAHACRDNVEDALEKMQACIDNAAQSLIPAEIDPEKVKQIAKQ